MFGLSIFEILLIVFLGLLLYRSWGRAKAREEARRGGASPAEPPPTSGTAAKTAPPAQELRECPVCGTFLSASNPIACARPDCPYPAPPAKS